MRKEKYLNKEEKDNLKEFLFEGTLTKDEENKIIREIPLFLGDIPFYDEDISSRNAFRRQLYTYLQLKNKGVNETEYNLLLDGLKKEIDNQYIRKSHIETRAGFLMAMWGILFGLIWQQWEKPVVVQYGSLFSISNLFLVLSILAGTLSFILLCICVWSQKFMMFRYSSIKINTITAMKYPNIFRVRLLEGYGRALEDNEEILEKKGKMLNIAIIMLGIFVLCMVSYVICGEKL